VVSPFETVVEGEFKQVMQLIEHIKDLALQGDSEEIIINIKLHCNKQKSLFIEDKIGKYTT